MSAFSFSTRRPPGSLGHLTPRPHRVVPRHPFLHLALAIRCLSLSQASPGPRGGVGGGSAFVPWIRPLLPSQAPLCQQCRQHRSFQITASARSEVTNKSDGSSQQQPHEPRQTVRGVLLRALWASFRSLGAPFQGRTLRKLYRQNPDELVLALVLLAGLTVVIVYVARVYFTYFYSEQFTRYPDPIARVLRRALYYSNYSPDNKMALKYYRQALAYCEELNLDPFSNDVMGIKIQLAAWLERIDNRGNATRVLEALLGDCKRWVEVMEQSVKDGTAPKGLLVPSGLQTKEGEPAPVPETLWGKRTRILGKAVGISVKLAELYSDEHVVKLDLAHERLIWAVETVFGELARRIKDGVKEGEGDWMSPKEIGGTLESLGHSYETKSQFHLALPLFFRALSLCKDPCHSAVLMNNIATCFAQHPVLTVGEAPVDTVMSPAEASASPAGRRSSYLAAARRWADNAKEHATEPQGELRTTECDEACAVALCNLAEIASLQGSAAEARERFEQAVVMSRRIGFAPGVTQAEAGLRALPAESQ
ncbi:hypothetical protein B0H67DRAFT_485860 [Lasiosphaeris hirsuta]|uniref:Uncharacterized protein n=1 Tax=Lasiosphaeris hirsuta TaxID=260670 RepID=A0AA40DZU7_9PEZI|nr:hypothetical protein B0H67DRAFT_485860 [Lasiosphaeris hirsuta]